MGSHAYATLGYGYDLGGDEGEYKLIYDPEELPWYDEDEGLAESANVVLAKAGVHGTTFKQYGNSSSGYTGYMLLVGPYLHKNWVAEVDLPKITDEHHKILAKALEVLGLQPQQAQPHWLLATHYG
jgi:hypothetical protein